MAISEAEAWRRLRREERAHREFVRKVRSIELTLDGLLIDMQNHIQAQNADMVERAVEKYAQDKYFLRVLLAFHVRKDATAEQCVKAWKATARQDGRIARLADDACLGWTNLAEVIRRIRTIYFGR